MTNKTITKWGPRLLILALLAMGLLAGYDAGLFHLQSLGVAEVGTGVAMLANAPLGLPDMWKVTTLTEAINKLPEMPTKIGDSGLFEESGITTTSAAFDSRDGVLTLVASTPRGSDPTPVKADKAKTRVIPAAHLVHDTVVKAEDIDDIRPFGGQTAVQGQAQVINDRLQGLRNRISATKEFHRMGALRGKVLDADGSVLVDLYQAFETTKKTAFLALGNAGTDVRGKIVAAKRAVEPSLGGLMVSGWRCYCSPSLYDALVNHANVKAAFANYQVAIDRLGGDQRKSGFVFGEVEFLEYNATVSNQKFMPDDLGTLFPVVRGLYKLYNAPADYNETVNTLGLPIYSKSEQRRMGRGWDLEAQANPLAICTRPDVLTELSLAAA